MTKHRRNEQTLPAPKTRNFVRRIDDPSGGGGLYAHMFREDIINGVFPYMSRSEKSNFKAALLGSIEDIEVARILLSTVSGRGSYDDFELIENAIRELTMVLAWNGEIYFELLKSTTKKAFGLSPIPRTGIYLLPLGLVQHVPPQTDVSRKRELIFVRRSSIWKLAMPDALGGVGKYKKLLKTLSKGYTDASQLTTWAISKNNEISNKLNYDFSAHRYMQDISRSSALRAWNWHQRRFEPDNFTEYYFFHRHLKFKGSLAILREHLVSEVNILFKNIGIDARIELEGFLCSNDFEIAANRMWNGELNFTEISKIIS